MTTTTFPLESDEHIVGQWAVDYVAPCGCRVPGHLAVTNRRVLFNGLAATRCFQKYLVGPVDAHALAYALDLDTEHVCYEGESLFFAIPKLHIENLTTEDTLLHHAISFSLRNNGSVHSFERRLLPIGALARAIQSEEGGRR